MYIYKNKQYKHNMDGKTIIKLSKIEMLCESENEYGRKTGSTTTFGCTGSEAIKINKIITDKECDISLYYNDTKIIERKSNKDFNYPYISLCNCRYGDLLIHIDSNVSEVTIDFNLVFLLDDIRRDIMGKTLHILPVEKNDNSIVMSKGYIFLK